MDTGYDRETSGGYVTNRAARMFVRALERRLLNGTAGQMPVFLALNDGAAYTQTELARIAAVEQPTMANTLQRMERDGLIARTPDPDDRRSSRVSLSKLGKRRAAEAMEAALAVNEVGFSGLSAAERETFFDLLHRVIARARGGRAELRRLGLSLSARRQAAASVSPIINTTHTDTESAWWSIGDRAIAARPGAWLKKP